MPCYAMHASQGDTRVFGKLHERHVEFNQQIFLIIIMGNFFWMLCCQSTVMVYMEIFNIISFLSMLPFALVACLLSAQIDGFLCYYLVGSPLFLYCQICIFGYYNKFYCLVKGLHSRACCWHCIFIIIFQVCLKNRRFQLAAEAWLVGCCGPSNRCEQIASSI